MRQVKNLFTKRRLQIVSIEVDDLLLTDTIAELQAEQYVTLRPQIDNQENRVEPSTSYLLRIGEWLQYARRNFSEET